MSILHSNINIIIINTIINIIIINHQYYYAPPLGLGALSDDARLTSVAYIGPTSRTERPRKTKIGTEVAHVPRDPDTTFKVKGSKVNLQGRRHNVAASRTACLLYFTFSR